MKSSSTIKPLSTQIPILQLKEFVPTSEHAFVYVNQLSAHLAQNHLLISHPHKHDFYLTVLFTQGQGVHNIDFESYPVRPGALFLLKPGQSHHWQLSADTDGFIFFHTAFFMPGRTDEQYPFHYYTSGNPMMVLTEAELQTAEKQLNELLKEYHSRLSYTERKVYNLIDNFYIDMTRIYPFEKHDYPQRHSAGQYVNRFEQLVEHYFWNEKSPGAYAEMLAITPRHLSRLTRAYLGKSAGTLIAERVVLEAKRRMAHANQSLQQVAEGLGFEEYAYFSRFFKKHAGISPRQFRIHLRKEKNNSIR